MRHVLLRSPPPGDVAWHTWISDGKRGREEEGGRGGGMGEKLCQVRDGEGDSPNTLRLPKQVIFDKTFSISSQKHFLSSSCRIGESRTFPFKFAVLLVVSCNRRPPPPLPRLACVVRVPPIAPPVRVSPAEAPIAKPAPLSCLSDSNTDCFALFFSLRPFGWKGGGKGYLPSA